MIFEEEYLKGKKWKEYGKKYDEDSKGLIFEYELVNGIINEKGKEYDKINGDLLFSGNYLNRKKNWKGEKNK